MTAMTLLNRAQTRALRLANGGLTLLALALSGCRSGSPGITEARADDELPNPSGVAVVELFTSEGCSSCPPADVALAALERQSASVYALEFHVDYWDDLGWPDRFSSPDWTQRQMAYAQSIGGSELYTPQIIVSGTDAFVGSDQRRAQADIARSLGKAASVHLSLHPRVASPGTVAVDFEAPGVPKDAMVDIALVQHEATTDVRAGENAGRTLRHVNVVRAFAAVRPPSSTVTLRVPTSLNRPDAEVIAFVQVEASAGGGMPILGAARAPLPE
jgi:hypothetical protein